MAYKLMDAAQARWRKVNAPELVALVQTGARLPEGQAPLAAHRHHAAAEPNQSPGTEEVA
jgi:hypothetical protein